MKRMLILLFGTTSYVAFLATFLYAIGFLGNFAVPKSIDSPSEGSFLASLWIDLGLLMLFAVQHSVMARPAFKRMLTRIIPVEAERSTYVLFSSLALLFLFWQWQPLGGVLWDLDGTVAANLMLAGFALGWGIVLSSTFVINHFDLFGLRQVWRQFVGQTHTSLPFRTPLLYRVVRHPLYVGWLLCFWCAPVMTATHLLFAFVTTGYILFAIQLEERDLMRVHPEYFEYRQQVPMLIPQLPREVVITAGQFNTGDRLAS